MPRARPHPAFTLVELIVAIAIVAILAGIILPRMLSQSGREGRVEAEAVAGLLGVASRRASMTTQRIALDYTDGALRLLTLRAIDPSSFEAGNLEWRPDTLSPVVRLSSLQIIAATLNGAPLDDRRWRVELGGDARPELILHLEADAGRDWTAIVSPETTGALLLGGDEPLPDQSSRIVDLDRAGGGQAPW